jgi:ubiquinol-cytochrome c reductase cytochrome b subunit
VEKGTYRIWYQDMLKEKGVPFWPNAAWRDLLFGIGAIFVILALAVIYGAPEIGAPPSPADIHSNPRPDWYLLWVFALFALMPRMLESYVIAFAPLVGVVFLLLIPFIFGTGERSPVRRPWSIVIVLFIVMIIGVLWVEGKRAPWSPRFDTKPLPEAVIGPVDSTAAIGATLFYKKGCQFCHTISGYGGIRGPNLTNIGDKLNGEEMTIRIVNGATNMPAFGAILSEKELSEIVAFLKTRKRYKQEKVPQAP